VFLRLAWRTVADIIARVVADGRATNDLLTGLRRVGIDEIAYRKGHGYLTVVVDHQTGRLVWAREGRNKDTLEKFFDELGAERAAELTHVSADGAEWIHAVVRDKAPQAVICLDPFHVVMWAMKALDKVRVRTMAKAGITDRHAMWAVCKNPADLTGEQRTSLAVDHPHQHDPLPRVSAQRATAGNVSGQGRHGPPAVGRLVVVGIAFPDPGNGRPRAHHRALPGPDLEHADHNVSNARSEATNTPPAGTDETDGLCPTLPGRAA